MPSNASIKNSKAGLGSPPPSLTKLLSSLKSTMSGLPAKIHLNMTHTNPPLMYNSALAEKYLRHQNYDVKISEEAKFLIIIIDHYPIALSVIVHRENPTPPILLFSEVFRHSDASVPRASVGFHL